MPSDFRDMFPDIRIDQDYTAAEKKSLMKEYLSIKGDIPEDYAQRLWDSEVSITAPTIEIPLNIDFPEDVDLPGGLDIEGGPARKKTAIIKIPGFEPRHVPLGNAVKSIVEKAAAAAAIGTLTATKISVAPTVLGILFDLRKLSTKLSPDQFRICRAILLVMQQKSPRMLTERGASSEEIREALELQGDEVPALMEHEISELIRLNVIETEGSGSTVFYKVKQ